MSDPFVLSIPMAPHGKERPRVSKGKAHMSKAYRAWKATFAWHARAGWEGPPWEGPIDIRILFATPTGNSRSDGDNAFGSCLDALQGIAYANDRQVKAGAYRFMVGNGPSRITVHVYRFTP